VLIGKWKFNIRALLKNQTRCKRENLARDTAQWQVSVLAMSDVHVSKDLTVIFMQRLHSSWLAMSKIIVYSNLGK
jgi:hypothetical protein